MSYFERGPTYDGNRVMGRVVRMTDRETHQQM